MRAWLSVYLKGVFMGAADAVPGVSGGTIALITGIYERLVGAIAAFDPAVLADLPRAYDARARARIAETVRAMDVAFLAVLGAGVLTAIVGVTGVVAGVEESSPAVLFAFFFGLIAASAVVLWGEVRLDTRDERAAAIAGLVGAFLLAGESAGAAVPHAPPVLFVAGGIAISAMILPGVSGSLLLILMGQYVYMSNALHEFIAELVAIARGGALEAALGPAIAVASFVAGAAVGILTFARVVKWALATRRQVTLTFLVALMVGALRLPAARILTAEGAWPVERVAATVLAGVAGAVAVLLIDRYTDDLEYVDEDPAEPTPAPGTD
ncbi:DUF368 domain-containing protein [Halorussus marinus]|uniref:DUF368 domain-containing protein n=1 Tax=Halorussus marinus TaxID=2505976 RepID=UPI001092FF0F|nr:DUF368 domain-containing protein [Halorussus marinus]